MEKTSSPELDKMARQLDESARIARMDALRLALAPVVVAEYCGPEVSAKDRDPGQIAARVELLVEAIEGQRLGGILNRRREAEEGATP